MDSPTTTTVDPLPSYPLPSSQKQNLDTWLDSLPIRPTPSFHGVYNETHVHFAIGPDGDHLVLLPCGCCFWRATIELHLSPGSRNEDKCPNCKFTLFQKWTLDGWIDEQQHIEPNTLSSEDRCCGICRMNYAEPAPAAQTAESHDDEFCSNPVKLSCNHVFGHECLLEWLKPAPNGGNGNSCPACRKEFFRAWPLVPNFANFEDGEVPDDEAVDRIPFRDPPDQNPHWVAARERVLGLRVPSREQAESNIWDVIEEHEYLEAWNDWVGPVPEEQQQEYEEAIVRRTQRNEERDQRWGAWMDELSEAVEFEEEFLRFREGLGEGQDGLYGELLERERLRGFEDFVRDQKPDWSSDRIIRVVDFLDGRFVMDRLQREGVRPSV